MCCTCCVLHSFLLTKCQRLTPLRCPLPTVRFGAWVKRTFSLKPSLERIREARKGFRDADVQTQQVDRMR
jgi:hypothetical protein